MPTDGERLATLEALFSEVRADVKELNDETKRTRKRLHDLEGAASALVEVSKLRREADDRRGKRIQLWLAAATTLAGFAAIFSPLITAALIGR